MLHILPISPQRFYCLDNIMQRSHHVTVSNRAVISSLLGPNILPEPPPPPPPTSSVEALSLFFSFSVRRLHAHKRQIVTALQPNLSFGILDRDRPIKDSEWNRTKHFPKQQSIHFLRGCKSHPMLLNRYLKPSTFAKKAAYQIISSWTLSGFLFHALSAPCFVKPTFRWNPTSE
jgi:hypothetical protein